MLRFSRTRFLAVLKKEFIHILRDRASLIMAIAMPLGMLLLFGYAVNTDVEHLPTVVWDQSQTQDSRDFVASVRNTQYMDPDYYASGYGQIENYLDSGKARAAVIIPPDFGRHLQGQRQASVQVLVDGSDPTIARAVTSAVQMLGLNKSLELQSKRLVAMGNSGGTALPLDVETRVWYNPDMKSRNFNIPALIGLILQNVIAMLTSFSIVREKERGTMEQLVVTPIRSLELLLGKLLPFVLIGFISLTLILATGIYWFGVVPVGSIPLLVLLSTIFLFTILAIGLLISSISKTQLQAMQMTFILILPSILLSGFVFPRETMPKLLQLMGGLLPLTYFLEIVRGIFLKGVGLQFLWQDTLTLCLFAVILLAVASKKFKKNLD
ncbi:ABC-type multidrug transport system, permease component [Desulfosporosinus acidiphilus SJ4]|uniref:Transport permease protein n=1 Tax=Desulfosporosinus acidiphilus (strain DSM 22704 / JCM 16185 / SJ4) TaxID=646529 RepID=I4D201_DESAJ|nr:ABC transporter permease [Desulfosporosinus acidiphilus]AFM39825.1 ABC-type multidrug transport system, permease component [Desulfosporosinus acidiphilus SJ4]